jgi:hypothetical protein
LDGGRQLSASQPISDDEGGGVGGGGGSKILRTSVRKAAETAADAEYSAPRWKQRQEEKWATQVAPIGV